MKRLALTAGITIGLFGMGCDRDDAESERAAPPADEAGVPPPTKTPRAEGIGPGVAPADSVESLAEELGVQFDNFARALESARSDGSTGKLTEIVPLVATEIRSIADRLEKLPEPSQEVKERIAGRMEEREREMENTFGTLDQFMEGLGPEIRSEVESALETFLRSMEQEEEVFGRYFEVREIDDAPPPPPAPLEE